MYVQNCVPIFPVDVEIPNWVCENFDQVAALDKDPAIHIFSWILCTMNIYTKCHGNPSICSYQDMSVWTKVID